MAWLNLIPAKIWGWISIVMLVLCLVFTAKHAWELKLKNSSLESSVKILEKTVEKTKELNQVKFDSLQKMITAQEGDLEKIQGQLPGIFRKIETINKLSHEKKNNLLQFTSVDSLQRFFSKRYQGKH